MLYHFFSDTKYCASRISQTTWGNNQTLSLFMSSKNTINDYRVCFSRNRQETSMPNKFAVVCYYYYWTKQISISECIVLTALAQQPEVIIKRALSLREYLLKMQSMARDRQEACWHWCCGVLATIDQIETKCYSPWQFSIQHIAHCANSISQQPEVIIKHTLCLLKCNKWLDTDKKHKLNIDVGWCWQLFTKAWQNAIEFSITTKLTAKQPEVLIKQTLLKYHLKLQ